jgi:sulfate adenylyltransferase subunit 1
LHTSNNLSWYEGPSLLGFLENVAITDQLQPEEPRFQVQYVIRPQTDELHDYRGYAGSILSGHFQVGDQIKVLPSGLETTISAIELNREQVQEAFRGEAVIIHLAEDLDVSRGNTIVPIDELPLTEKSLEATICWMDNSPFQPGQKLLLQQNSFRTKAVLKELTGKIDIHTYEQLESDGSLKLNDFAHVTIKTAEAVSTDPYTQNRKTGAFILINENTNNTVAAGIFN